MPYIVWEPDDSIGSVWESEESARQAAGIMPGSKWKQVRAGDPVDHRCPGCGHMTRSILGVYGEVVVLCGRCLPGSCGAGDVEPARRGI